MGDFMERIKSSKPVLVDFFAEWCGPYKILAPVLNEVKSTTGEKISILKVDVDRNPQVSAHFGIRGVPTLVLFKDGTEKWRHAGLITAGNLIKKIEPHF